jgi:hypothetical protein
MKVLVVYDEDGTIRNVAVVHHDRLLISPGHDRFLEVDIDLEPDRLKDLHQSHRVHVATRKLVPR